VNRREKLAVVGALALLDATGLIIALRLAFYLRIGSNLLPYHSSADIAAYTRLVVFFVPAWLLIYAAFRLYDADYLLGGPQEYAQVVKACTFGMVGLLVLSFVEHGTLFSRGWLLLSWGLSIVLVGTARFLFRRVIFRLRRRGLFTTRAIIVGADEQARTIASQLSSPNGAGVDVVGFVDDYLPPWTRVVGDLRILGTPSELLRLVQEKRVGELIVVPHAMAWESFQEIIREAASGSCYPVIRLSPGYYEILTTGVTITHKAFVPLLTLGRARITGIDAFLKRSLDYTLGFVLLTLASPLMVAVAVVVALTEGRPVLERHRVHGLQGRKFNTLKFRTGLLGAVRRSLASPVLAKVSTNPGHLATRSGRLLYQTGLDKLPQLFNVMAGQMSLVGPRTISVGGEARYGQWLPSMLTVKPGVTGPWAVANCPTLDDEIRLIMYYIRNWTIWLDLQVIFQTVVRMFWRRRGEA
jgi:lipopolysaccharide/colanic/teichoic acid biosynthesis glycosyltransferase